MTEPSDYVKCVQKVSNLERVYDIYIYCKNVVPFPFFVGCTTQKNVCINLNNIDAASWTSTVTNQSVVLLTASLTFVFMKLKQPPISKERQGTVTLNVHIMWSYQAGLFTDLTVHLSELTKDMFKRLNLERKQVGGLLKVNDAVTKKTLWFITVDGQETASIFKLMHMFWVIQTTNKGKNTVLAQVLRMWMVSLTSRWPCGL